MTQFFADTLYWGALFNRRDQWHDRVLTFSHTLTPADRLWTTDAVLTEVLAMFSGAGEYLRIKSNPLDGMLQAILGDIDIFEIVELVQHSLANMDDLEMTRKELEPLIGSRGRASEVLNRKRLLTLSIIRKLHEVLHIPLEVLAQPYQMQPPTQKNRAEA